MTARPSSGSSRAAELRREFDQAFADPPPLAAAPGVNLLAVHIAAQPYALRLTQIDHLLADRRIVPVPSPMPELAGLLGFRGAIVPVYALGPLLGYGAAAASRWVVLVGGAEPLGLAFDGFEGHLQVAPADLAPVPAGSAARRHVPELCRTPQGIWPLLDLASVLEEIRERAQTQGAERRDIPSGRHQQGSDQP